MQHVKTVIKKHWPKLTIVLWLLLQLPFLTADLPDSLSYSRGPYSDEGLNTFAIRNFINSDFQEFSESDNFIKSPVLNLYLFAPFAAFQNDLLVGRIAMLLLVAFLFWQIIKRVKYGWILVLLFSLTPILFHFSRLMMGDLTSVLIPLVGLVIYSSWVNEQKEVGIKKFTLLVLFTSLAVGVKIQGIALFGIFLVSAFLIPLSGLNRIKRFYGLIIGSLPVFFLFLFVILKQTELFDYIYNQVPEYYQAKKYTLVEVFNFNWGLHFQSAQGRFLVLVWAMIGFFLLTLAAKFWWKKLLMLLPFLVIWLYEFSGMFMIYFPPRYAVGLYAASFVLLVILVNESRYILEVIPKFASIFLAIVLLTYTGKALKEDFGNRQFRLIEMNKRVAQDDNVSVLIGSWAPSLNFTSKRQLAFPIWDSYLIFKEIDKPIEYYNADLIVAEHDEGDSGGAYKKRGVDLSQYLVTDSIEVSRFSLFIHVK